jgi:hypothetical protein
MANWLTSELNAEPVNLDYVYSFKKVDKAGEFQLVFQILKDSPIVWRFPTQEQRDSEYANAMALVKGR